jgi:hypothetical protein
MKIKSWNVFPPSERTTTWLMLARETINTGVMGQNSQLFCSYVDKDSFLQTDWKFKI